MRIAVCDDERWMRDELSKRLAEYGARRRLAISCVCFENGQAVLESNTSFDALFLDIQMSPPDGMETARKLRAGGFDGPLVFTTVLRDAIFDAFEVQAFDYLVKPVENPRFVRIMDRLVETLQRAEAGLVIQKGTVCHVVPFSHITYCEVIGRKIYVHQLDEEPVDYYEKMEALIPQMDGRFFRCHRSYLVNLDQIRGCRNGTAALADGSAVPVSRLRERELTQALMERMRKRWRPDESV